MGKTLTECMEQVTHREFLLWQLWFDDEWNQPDRTDHYLMEIAAEVRRVLHKKPKTVKARHFQLEFGRGDSPKLSVEEATRRAKAVWAARLNPFRKQSHGQ